MPISAPPALPCDLPQRPNATGLCFHSPFVPGAGCSHQPNAQTISRRPSPLTSPTPSPCELFAAQGPGSEIGVSFQGCVGAAGSGFASTIVPPGIPITTSGLPSPSTSAICVSSIHTSGVTTYLSQRLGSPRGFTNRTPGPSPLLPVAHHSSGQPSPVKSH